jgi:hypothetical protein
VSAQPLNRSTAQPLNRSRELNHKRSVVEPGHSVGLVGEPAVDQVGIVRTLVESDEDAGLINVDSSADVEQALVGKRGQTTFYRIAVTLKKVVCPRFLRRFLRDLGASSRSRLSTGLCIEGQKALSLPARKK